MGLPFITFRPFHVVNTAVANAFFDLPMCGFCVTAMMFVGPLVIEYYGLTGYSFQAQLGVCFMVAAPAWLGWCVVSRQFERWRKARNPINTIRRDVKR